MWSAQWISVFPKNLSIKWQISHLNYYWLMSMRSLWYSPGLFSTSTDKHGSSLSLVFVVLLLTCHFHLALLFWITSLPAERARVLRLWPMWFEPRLNSVASFPRWHTDNWHRPHGTLFSYTTATDEQARVCVCVCGSNVHSFLCTRYALEKGWVLSLGYFCLQSLLSQRQIACHWLNIGYMWS